jgi:preprotein translocase subunit Sec63
MYLSSSDYKLSISVGVAIPNFIYNSSSPLYSVLLSWTL